MLRKIMKAEGSPIRHEVTSRARVLFKVNLQSANCHSGWIRKGSRIPDQNLSGSILLQLKPHGETDCLRAKALVIGAGLIS